VTTVDPTSGSEELSRSLNGRKGTLNGRKGKGEEEGRDRRMGINHPGVSA